MTDRVPIPADLADRWEWHGAALRRIGEELYIAFDVPRVFDEARSCDAARARLRAARPLEQTRMEL